MFNVKKFEEVNDRLAVIEGNLDLALSLLEHLQDRLKAVQDYVESAFIKLDGSKTDLPIEKKDERLNAAGLYNYRDYRIKHPAVSIHSGSEGIE